MKLRLALLVVAAGIAAFGYFCVVVIEEREQAFRTALGEAEFSFAGLYTNRPVLDEPGLYVRIPGFHELYRFDRRRLHFDAEPFQVLTAEKQQIEVDYFVIWRIENSREVFERVRSLQGAVSRLDDATFSSVQNTIPQYTLRDLLSEQRDQITATIVERANAQLQPLGIQVLDLRIRRTDYPDVNLEQVFSRMRTERNRIALRFRAEGDEQARRIRSKADEESQVILSTAERDSTQLRGDGDAEATRIYAEAYGADPEFYTFLRSLEAYRSALDDQTTLILSPDAPFLRYLFQSTNGEASPGR